MPGWQSFALAVNEPNLSAAVVYYGDAPADANQMYTISVRAAGRLTEVEQYKLRTFASAACTAIRNAQAYAELARVVRNGFVESRHYGSVVVLAEDGVVAVGQALDERLLDARHADAAVIRAAGPAGVPFTARIRTFFAVCSSGTRMRRYIRRSTR